MKKATLLLLILLISNHFFAQVTTSNISGKITDNKKEPLYGATIVATHTPSGSQYYAVSDPNGYYHLLNIRPGGPYKLVFRMMGYQSHTQGDIMTTMGETKTLNVILNEESIGLNEVTIQAKAPSNGPDHSGTTTTVSNEQIATLPTISRNLNEILSLTPQASSTSNGLAIGGGNYRQSYVTVDGASFHNAYGIGNNLPAGGTPIALEALESVKISIAPYDVRQSGFIGGNINAITKSGSNQLHVSIYDYFTSDKLFGTEYGRKNAGGQYPESLKLGRSIENTSGFSIGGPLKKNKLFYFINFEYQCDIDQGQSRFARENESSYWGGNTQYNRPTVTMMDSIRSYLQNTYQYDPGEYQNYSFSTPD